MAPADKLRIPDNEALQHIGVAREVLEALAAAPDGELVRVEERDELVVITKEGRSLRVHVSGKKENVTVNVPLTSRSRRCRARTAASAPRPWPARSPASASRTSSTSATATTT